MSFNGYRKKCGAGEPQDIEVGNEMTETKNVLQVGSAGSNHSPCDHPPMRLLAVNNHVGQSWWQRTCNQMREVITLRHIVTAILGLCLLSGLLLIVAEVWKISDKRR